MLESSIRAAAFRLLSSFPAQLPRWALSTLFSSRTDRPIPTITRRSGPFLGSFQSKRRGGGGRRGPRFGISRLPPEALVGLGRPLLGVSHTRTSQHRVVWVTESSSLVTSLKKPTTVLRTLLFRSTHRYRSRKPDRTGRVLGYTIPSKLSVHFRLQLLVGPHIEQHREQEEDTASQKDEEGNGEVEEYRTIKRELRVDRPETPH